MWRKFPQLEDGSRPLPANAVIDYLRRTHPPKPAGSKCPDDGASDGDDAHSSRSAGPACQEDGTRDGDDAHPPKSAGPECLDDGAGYRDDDEDEVSHFSRLCYTERTPEVVLHKLQIRGLGIHGFLKVTNLR